MSDRDDSAMEEQWCAERRAQITSYLQSQGLDHGRVGEWPAWHVAPYVSIWAIGAGPDWLVGNLRRSADRLRFFRGHRPSPCGDESDRTALERPDTVP